MVCETKIVAAEDHEALPGAKKDALLAAAMWPPLPAAPPPGPQSLGGAGGAGPPGGRGLCIREFRAAEQEAARRIFYDGIMERIPNTAFRGLRQHPRTQLLYVLLAGQCAGTCRRPRCPASAGTRAGLSPLRSPHLGRAREGRGPSAPSRAHGHAPARLPHSAAAGARWPLAVGSVGAGAAVRGKPGSPPACPPLRPLPVTRVGAGDGR